MKDKLLFLSLLALTLAPAGAAVRYVNLANPSPAPPYTTWASAATNIQDAIDAANAGDEIVVTNGVYATGGRAMDAFTTTNRVTVTNAVTVRSVNGPDVTVIRGYQVPITTNGDGAVRCVYLANGAVMTGFTLTNGATSGWIYDGGGGAFGGTLSNCTLAGNSALQGGGAFLCTLNNCKLIKNSATFGGGASGGTLNNCTLANNSASQGGGAYRCTLNNCLVTGNWAGSGGGAAGGELNNCTVARNCAANSGGGITEASYLFVTPAFLRNCVAYHNQAPIDANYSQSYVTMEYSCTTPLPPGPGNIDADPAFANGSCGFRLRSGSPCIDAGTNLSGLITTDIVGTPRPLDGNGDGVATFDMGAYEFDPEDEQSSAPGARARPVFAAGRGHNAAIKADGSLWAWGDNNFGQLGIGSEMQHTNALTRVGTDQDWKTVATGVGHTLAVKRDGSLWAWGSNINGELGVEVEPSVDARSPHRVGTDTDWQMVYAGPFRSLGLRWDGSLWAWGGNWAGSLGLGDDAPVGTNRPTRVGSESDWAWVGGGGPASFAIKHDGSLWAWGHMAYFPAQLGLGDLSTGTNVPMQVGFDNDWERVVSVIYDGQVAVYGPSLAVKSDGSLWSWGLSWFGELGDPAVVTRSSPGRVGESNDWATVELGIGHAIALRRDGSLWTWGQNFYGQLGLGVDFGPNQLEPTRVGPDNDWVAVAAGQDYSIGLKSDGSLWSWGNNRYGQLGLGDLSQTNVPTRIGTDNDWALPSSAVRGEFRIVAQSINVDQSRTLFFTHTNSRAYYVLYRGDSLTSITTPVDAVLASSQPSLTDRTLPATNATAFYRIRAVPRTQPLDLDGDGIDDYYELRHAAFLNPLNSPDAAQDTDGDGYSNLAEYRVGTDPARPTVRHSIASGLAHTVVLKQDGSLWAWGTNTSGQLGDGTYEMRTEPARIGTDTDWISVSAGRDSLNGDFTVALKRDGSLWAWGANYWGQLGYPPDQIPGTNVPIRMGNSSAWTEVSAGGGYTAALQRNGSLWVWGNNNYNILPCCNPSWTPSRVGTDTDWTTLSAGGTHILALKADQSLWAWGDNSLGQCGLGEGVSVGSTPTRIGTDNDWFAIAASGDTDIFNGTHSLGLKADGTLWSWAYDQAGEIGLDATGFNQLTPARVGTDADWAAIAVSGGTSLARKRDGSLWAWGFGIGTVPTSASTRYDWRDFAAGGVLQNGSFPNFANAVASDGSLWTWRFGPVVSRVPVQIGTETNWTAITAGVHHSLALNLDGGLWSWGYNGDGELGDGSFTSTSIPHRIASNTSWRAVSAGVSHTAAIREDGTLWTWGAAGFGQLGIGNFGTNPPYVFRTPQPVESNTTWSSVAAGGYYTAGLRTDGSLWTWGDGRYGQLGNGLFVTNAPYGIASPFAVEPGMTWSAVAAGGWHTIGLRPDGSLWACGQNYSGQLGLGFATTNIPSGIGTLQRIPTNVIWQSIASRFLHTLALNANGKLWAWGWNGNGQLGNGSSDTTNSPQFIAPDKTWKAVAAGYYHSVALDSDRTLWTWGANYTGLLGIGTSDSERNTPQPVQPSTTWKAIAAGGYHTLAIREDGTLWSWGWNANGQLGIPPDLTPTRLGTDTDWGSPP